MRNNRQRFVRGSQIVSVTGGTCDHAGLLGEPLRFVEISAFPSEVRAQAHEPATLGRVRGQPSGSLDMRLCLIRRVLHQPGTSALSPKARVRMRGLGTLQRLL